MPTKEELVTIFRKENEDLTQANVRNIYKAKRGTFNLEVGDNVIVLPTLTVDEAYTDPSEYEIRFHKAIETNGAGEEDDVDIKMALVINNKTAVSFTVNSPVVGYLEWETFLLVPNFNFWT